MKEISGDELQTRKNLSKTLTKLMQERSMTNKDLSEVLGVSESTVGKWILLKSTPRMGVIEKMADYFKVNKSYLIEERENISNLISLKKSNPWI